MTALSYPGALGRGRVESLVELPIGHPERWREWKDAHGAGKDGGDKPRRSFLG